ncbi:TraB/GumN family protein [Ectothiorhodospira lacustris]|uniref:TraB/GumN family protein n=1 Tax=Ectothiorhodospira lacustris TaxID=2899127 RepID=UPI001EE8FCC6|nr:TraB/GumN family protein [Ectothiorhodospira lacustris]MCG5500755.1 TraB/GumN family protein [Ectothiorhodospira lacustris]MCG5510891.1 TraB/GumN family protein [Ectothiorhodospira lacustris]MCG5522563.1 TraB/GumN family protein [Ectothiorhodospira lacustris]
MDHQVASSSDEPQFTLTLDGTRITVLGTAHVSRVSAEAVSRLLQSGGFDAVAVELCPSRHHAILNPDALAQMNLFQVLRQGKVPMVTASLALGAYQQRLAEQFGIEPGAEMRAAIDEARQAHLPVLLIDREVGTTLKRCYRNVPWWRRINLFAGLMASVVSKEKISEEEIERLKSGDVLESTFTQFAEESRALYTPLIQERDHYMAARLRQEAREGKYRHILAVVGAGHLQGIRQALAGTDAESPADLIRRLDQEPPPAMWPKVLPWLVVALVIFGFILGFSRNPELGWQLVMDWVLINGTLAGIGGLIAGGHPVTVVTAALAAPLTSLNPTIGVGFVAAAMETFLRKPTVGDFSRLRQDTTHLRGWWKNRVSRVLLVFLFTTLGSAIGTYAAGFRIAERLLGS